MLKVQPRHTCGKGGESGFGEADQFRGCKCPLWILGTIPGMERVRKPISKYIAVVPEDRDAEMALAQKLAAQWWARKKVESLIGDVALAASGERRLLKDAINDFLAAKRFEGKKRSTMNAYRVILLEKHPWGLRLKKQYASEPLLLHCEAHKRLYLDQLTPDFLASWIYSWSGKASGRRSRLLFLKAFFKHCHERELIEKNPVAKIKNIKADGVATGYFTSADYEKLIRATSEYQSKIGVVGKGITANTGARLCALIELMRWSGLRIHDAANLERSRVTQDEDGTWRVFIRRNQKTGEPVYSPIPPHVAELLNSAAASPRYFFATGESEQTTAARKWQPILRRLFKLADLREADGSPKYCRPHMLRDTWAVEALAAGMKIENVSAVLAHSSVKVTEAHYLPWVKLRQDALTADVKGMWQKLGVAGPKVVPIRQSA